MKLSYRKLLAEAWILHDQRIKPYVWSQRFLGLSSTLISLYFVISLLSNNGAKLLEVWLATKISQPFLLWVVYFGVVLLVLELITLPLGVGHHCIERRFELSKQAYGSWTWDQMKGLLVGAVVGTIALGLIFLSQKLSLAYWWLIAALFMILFSVLLAQLGPVIFIPLFYKLRPMAEGSLKSRLLALCSRFGIQVEEVYHLGLGEKTEKGNAAFAGLGKTKKIMIGDTLYERYPEDEVEAVFAHELGHQVHNDLWKGIGFSSFFVVLTFFLSDWLMRRFFGGWFGTAVGHPFGLFLFFLLFSVIQYPLGLVQLLWSRYRERLADGFAAQTIGVGKHLADSLEKLTFQNYSLFCPHPFIEYVRYSHPAPWRRILRLRGELGQR